MRPCGSFVAIIAAATLVTLLACVALSGAPAGARSSVAGPPNLRGDVNCDLAFNALDILQVLDSQTGLPANTGCAQAAGVGCDTGGFISNAVIALLRELAGLTTPPGECLTPTPSPTPANTGTTSASPSPTSSGLTSSPTETPTLTPTATPTASSTGTVTPTPTATPTGTPTATPSPSPTPAPCDQLLAINDNDPMHAAEAIGLCSGSDITSAAWVLPDGSTPAPTGTPGVNEFNLGHGIKGSFGSQVVPREGARLLALSNGRARVTGDPNYTVQDPGTNRGYTNAFPATFPRSEKADGVECLTPSTAYDGIGLKVQLTVPQGATGLSFDWNFYTEDYPDWVCSPYTDTAAVMLAGQDIMLDGSVPQPQAIDVNSVYVQVCENGAWGAGGGGPSGSRITCTSPGELAGTGFDQPRAQNDEGAATGWRTTDHSVTGGQQIALVFTIWDAGDGTHDSTVLFDNFRWTYP